MCKVFKPMSGTRCVDLYVSSSQSAHLLHCRCPHVKDVCRNRAAHPRCDVVYLKNAEGMFLASSCTATAVLKRVAYSADLQRVWVLQGMYACCTWPDQAHVDNRMYHSGRTRIRHRRTLVTRTPVGPAAVGLPNRMSTS